MSGRAWLVQTMRKGKNLYANASRLLLLIKIYIFFLRVDKDIHCSFIQQTCSCRVGIACTLYTITDRKVPLHLLGKWKCSRSPSTARWGLQVKANESYDPICHLRTGSPWFDVFDSFIAFICAFAALPAADLSNSSCLQVEGKKGYNWG